MLLQLPHQEYSMYLLVLVLLYLLGYYHLFLLIVLSIIVSDFFNNDIVLAFDKYVKSLDESSPILNSFLILSFILSIPIFSFTDISI